MPFAPLAGDFPLFVLITNSLTPSNNANVTWSDSQLCGHDVFLLVCGCCWRIRMPRSCRWFREGGGSALLRDDPTQPLHNPKNSERHGREHVFQTHLLPAPVASSPDAEQTNRP